MTLAQKKKYLRLSAMCRYAAGLDKKYLRLFSSVHTEAADIAWLKKHGPEILARVNADPFA